MQRDVWFPAMREAGMPWGALGVAGDALLVLSGWPDGATHDAYRRDRVPALRERADVAADMASVDGDLVALGPAWWVGPGAAGGSVRGGAVMRSSGRGTA